MRFRQMMGIFVQYDKTQIVLKLRGAAYASASRSVPAKGRKPYAYCQSEAEVIARMKALRAEGLGFARIAAKLNEEGIPPRSGKRWHNFAVNQILSRS